MYNYLWRRQRALIMRTYLLIYLLTLRACRSNPIEVSLTDLWDWKCLLMWLKLIFQSWRSHGSAVMLFHECWIWRSWNWKKINDFPSSPSPRHPSYIPLQLHPIMSYSDTGLVKKKWDQPRCNFQEKRRKKDLPTPGLWWRWLKTESCIHPSP